MRVNWLSVVVFSLLLLTLVLTGKATAGTDGVVAQGDSAQLTDKSNEAAASPAAGEVDVSAGVWRGGKAVFSDEPILDPFNPYQRGYKPKQPIAFSHKIHVEKNKMECQYCHYGVAKSPASTIPPVELCMGCHENVMTDRPEIKKLTEIYKEGKELQWEPVHNLPEHAFFNHERHIKAGLGCQNCHGLVNHMDEVEKVSSMRMGWCVSCHRMNGASFDCAVCHY